MRTDRIMYPVLSICYEMTTSELITRVESRTGGAMNTYQQGGLVFLYDPGLHAKKIQKDTIISTIGRELFQE